MYSSHAILTSKLCLFLVTYKLVFIHLATRIKHLFSFNRVSYFCRFVTGFNHYYSVIVLLYTKHDTRNKSFMYNIVNSSICTYSSSFLITLLIAFYTCLVLFVYLMILFYVKIFKKAIL